MEDKVSFGHLEEAFKKSKITPTLNVTARIDAFSAPEVDTGYRKREVERLRKEVKVAEDQIANWDHEDVSKKALSSLKTDLAVKRARMMESEALLGPKGRGVVGAKGKGAVVGGPYEIRPKSGKFQVVNMETGQVRGTHDNKDKAMRQFRLLEMIHHQKGKKK